LKNLGALSEYAKRSQSSPKFKKILILYLAYNDMVKKPSHATVPLNSYARVDFIFHSWTLDLASVFYFRESIKVEDFSRDHPLYQSLAPLRYMY
jgi:hypothetical protein